MTAGGSRYLAPGALDRLFGRLLAAAVRLGIVRGHFYVLEVRGRKSGRAITLPVDLLEIDGRRYLVSPRGETNWARNARAAGELVLARGRRREHYSAHEVPLAQRPPLLKAYLDRYAAEVQRFFPVAKGSLAEAFEAIAADYPVFELAPAAAPQTSPQFG